MILEALAKYYDILLEDADTRIAPPGYCIANVSYALNLSVLGELLDIFPLIQKVQRGKQVKEVPLRLIVPEQWKRAVNIAPNFLCDNSAYVLGLTDKDAKDPDYALKRFQSFQKFNLELLEKADCVEARAVIGFLKNYHPQSGIEMPVISSHLMQVTAGGNLVFKIDEIPGYVHENAVIRRVWEVYRSEGSALIGQCLVTGEIASIARLHPSIQGIRDANSTGATLVGFNAPAYESYNRSKGQGLNSPVSEKATFAYSTALKYLLSPENPNRKFVIGDATVVYWAESPSKAYAETFMNLFEPEESIETQVDLPPGKDYKVDQWMRETADKVRRGQALDVERLMVGLDPATRFFILGLSPNSARIAVRFFHTDPFEKLIRKIMAHYIDLQIEKEYDNQPTYIPVRRILYETTIKAANDPKPTPLLSGVLLRAILENTAYPAALYSAILIRIRADHDINYYRAAVIKAYLTRKYRYVPINPFQEVLCMSLNEQSTNQAYLLGRLFAVLEKAQQEAARPAKLNATIKDRYFTSACASPASVFPVLLRLSQHHISKAQYGYVYDNQIEQILNRLDIDNNPIPSHLTLDEQGIFIMGYYHQRAYFYVPRNNKVIEEQESDESN